MTPKKFEYTTILFKPDKGGVYAGFPYDGVAEFGTRKAVRVLCTIDSYQYKCCLLPMGDGHHALHVRKEIRNIVGKDVDDEVKITIEQDLSPRIVVVPDDFQWLLDDDPELKDKFDKLTIPYKEAIFTYINQAKLPETRAKRINQMIDRIRIGERWG